MDVCVEFMLNAPDEAWLSRRPTKRVMFWELGDPICAYPAEQMGVLQANGDYLPKTVPVYMERTGFLFVKNIDSMVLGEPMTVARFSGLVTEGYENPLNWRLNKAAAWNFWQGVSPAIRRNLTDNKYATVEYQLFNQALSRKINLISGVRR